MNVFNLMAKLSLDKSEYENGLNESKSSAAKFAQTVGKGVAAVGKATLTGVTVAAAGVTKITKDAIANFADYEQLVGGVETLFKNSASVVQSYADNAYKTAGLSANQYMETVTSFSASLLQSLDGDTASAAKVADMAITDMADNANKMGTSMESIQNAYQGFAKQNYTMLDNLKLGYGGTKEEMQRLLDDAEKLSGVKYDMSSLNDVYEAIHVVQNELGITGTTAKEASETISGSLSMAKSAFQNLLTGIADDNADFDSLITNFVDSVGVAADNILPRVEIALNGVGDLIAKLAPIIGEKLPPLMEEILPSLLSSATILLASFTSALPDLLSVVFNQLPNVINTLVPVLITTFGSLVSTIVQIINENAPMLLESAIFLISELATGISSALPELIPTVIEIILELVNTLISNAPMLIDSAIALIEGLATGLINSLPTLIEKVPTIIENLINAFVNNLPKIIEMGIKLIVELAVGLVKAIPQLVKAIPQIVMALINGFGSLLSEFGEVGKNIVSGLWEGIKSGWEWLTTKVQELADKLVDGVKGVLGIHSPSKVFAGIGHFMAEGLDEGWSDEFSDVQKNINGSLDFSAEPLRMRPTNEQGSEAKIISWLEQNLPILLNQSIVLDTGVLVGQTVGAMDNALGKRMQMNARYA